MDIPKKQISKKFIAAALLCMFAFIYVIHHIGNAFKENTELFTVTAETLENTVDVSGYIFRDEAVLAGSAVACSYNYSDGAKVASGAKVAAYIASEDLRVKYEEIRSRIEILEASNSLLHIDLAEVDREIAGLRTEIAVKSTSGDLSFLAEAEKELLVLLHKRELAERNQKEFSEELAALKAEFSALQVSASSMGGGVVTPEAGYFYSYTDGYEGFCTAEAAKSISFEIFDGIEAMSPKRSDAAVGKVAAVGKWYYICKMSIEAAEEIVSDETYNCVFTDNSCKQSLPLLTEEKIVDYTRGEVLLVFSCMYMPDEFDFSRIQRAKVTVAEISGLRVPASSVRVLPDGQTIVYIIKEGICRPRNIEILFEKGGYCVVSDEKTGSNVDLYDRIITGDKNLYDGKVIDY
ncbi:MAG: hypothetical protein IJX27_09705 [Clostridia bacterium]|nr:hypothetical protein [Clostridia bacterium]